MTLKRIAIDRLPGIDKRFEIELAGQGMQVIFGPNGIGKSSICRAVAGLYWTEIGSSRQTTLRGEFEWDGEVWRAEREGSTVRWDHDGDGVSPSLPPSHNKQCFFLQLRDLVAPSQDATYDIAKAIRLQMYGGFGLQEIGSGLFSPITPHRKRRDLRNFNTVANEVRGVEADQFDLQRRIDRLDELKAQLKEAETAAGRVGHVERAIGLANRRGELAAAEQQLAALPGTLAKLTGRESKDVEQHQERLAGLEKRAGTAETELRNAKAAQEESGLADPLVDADIETWKNRAEDLKHTESKLGAANADAEAARDRVTAALDAVGGNLIDGAALTLPNHTELFDFLRSCHAHATAVSAIEEQLRLLKVDGAPEGDEPPTEDKPPGKDEPTEADDLELDDLRNGMDALRSWLRTPKPQSFAANVRARWAWLAVALTLLLAGIGFAWFAEPSMALIAAFGAGVGLTALFMGEKRRISGRGTAAREKFEELNLEAPKSWDVRGVQARLRSLESRAARLDVEFLNRNQLEADIRRLKSRLAALREKEPELESSRQTLRATLGLDKLRSDADLVDYARALDQLRLSCADYEAIKGKVRAHRSLRDKLLTQLADVLERHGEPRPVDAAAVSAHLNKLEGRNQRHVQSLDNERNAQMQLKGIDADRKKTLREIKGIYTEAGLADGDDLGLSSLLDMLPTYNSLTKTVAEFEKLNEYDCRELEKVGESGLSEVDARSLGQFKAELEQTVPKADALRSEIHEIESRTKQARGGSALQQLIGAREDARAKLRDLRDDALYARAGEFLIDEIEQDFEATRMPRVLERARNNFSAFTFHNYELHLDKRAAQPRLYAEDLRTRQRRELEELSDGTRVQLLLAARIAFAEEVEQGKVLPLFLDEALDQSDPERFAAIVRSLEVVAREQGRQIIYLTSDPVDVERIRAALGEEDRAFSEPIDLGLIRTGAVSIGGPETLKVDPTPTVAAPDGRSPEDYGAALNVPAFLPSRGSPEQHVFYLLWDDLDLLHEFLSNGIERVGQWKTVAGTPLAERLSSRLIDAAQIGLRVDLLRTFCGLWKQGRGRPVDADILSDSDMKTSKYFDAVVEIARERNGDAEQLLTVLERRADSRLKGIHQNSIARLRQYLADEGCLDERPILGQNELRLHALSSPAANELSGGVADECLHRWWQWAQKTVAHDFERHPS